ncbi:MAG: PIN domain nuclease [Endomicrobia bacterium]|nr:PIN domain nuclease [Endomicrobiia bacterium]MCX7940583.1 PIN domain nuclease [Endomicrobiia bacterium]MDW8056277.1 PIN domain nuclease [Elusimicrobiota bacterium]
MILWFIRGVIVIISSLVGFFIQKDYVGVLLGAGFGIVIILLEILISRIKLDTLIAAFIGMTLGIIAAQLVDYLIFLLEEPKIIEIFRKFLWLVRIGFAYLGLIIAVRKKVEVDLLDKDILHQVRKSNRDNVLILDTSMIIDGRIVDIYQTKFIDGPMVVPRFILNELQLLADSQDHNKRLRAKRGLEMLGKLKDEKAIVIADIDYPEMKETDAKLIKFAKNVGGKILTVDYNLNKIATLEGISVLNINDLANALKPIFLPGETFSIYILKEGKDYNQGVGYLDDGTMVVVEDGRKFINRKIDVVVTSTLQTSSGRIIFTKPI